MYFSIVVTGNKCHDNDNYHLLCIESGCYCSKCVLHIVVNNYAAHVEPITKHKPHTNLFSLNVGSSLPHSPLSAD